MIPWIATAASPIIDAVLVAGLVAGEKSLFIAIVNQFRRENMNNGISNDGHKARMCKQLNSVVDELSPMQINVLLLQALTLAAEDDREALHAEAIQSLSKRELEVLVLVANGYNRKNIGSSLGISVNTAARHIANIYSKLGISSVAEATSLAYTTNVIGSIQSSTGRTAIR